MYVQPQHLEYLESQSQQLSDLELIQWWIQRKGPVAQKFNAQVAHQFLQFVKKPLAQVTISDLRGFETHLKLQKRKSRTYQQQLQAIKSLLAFGQRVGALPVTISLRQRSVRRRNSRWNLEPFLGSPMRFGFSWAICVCLFFNLGWMTPRLLGQVPNAQNTIAERERASESWVKVSQVQPEELSSDRIDAFLDTIAVAEGTHRPNGYRTQYTGAQFSDFQDHPREVKCGKRYGRKLCSDAAGRYQFLSTTWDRFAKKIGAEDFSPLNQDRAAIKLIEERGALEDVRSGRFEAAVRKLSAVWPSFRRLGNGSLEKSLPRLKQIYQQKLGTQVEEFLGSH